MFDFGKALGGVGKWEGLRGAIGAFKAGSETASGGSRNRMPRASIPEILRMFSYVPSHYGRSPRPRRGPARLRTDRGGLQPRRRMVDARRPLRLCLAAARAAARRTIPTAASTGSNLAITRRGGGEAASIQAMVEQMIRENGIDPRRVFITGLSAGGAMTSVMLACYPELFAGGAIIAGLPYGAAGNVQQALSEHVAKPIAPRAGLGRSGQAGGAGPQRPWPRVSVWHGSADTTVIPSNASEIVKQWADVHGVQSTPSRQTVVDGYPRQVWLDAAGEEVIESYSITAHGARHAARHRRRRFRMRRRRPVPHRGRYLVVVSHRKILRPDQRRRPASFIGPAAWRAAPIAGARQRCGRRHPAAVSRRRSVAWRSADGRTGKNRLRQAPRRLASISAR